MRVTVVFPGAIATNITQNSGIAMPADAGNSAQSFPMTSADKAAETIINGMERDKFQVYIGRDSKMMNYLYRLNPRYATRFMYNQMKSLLPA